MRQFLVFAGTTEGRRLAELLCLYPCTVTACVATEYGRQALPTHPQLSIITGRLCGDEISALLAKTTYDCVFDATHPYAGEITENCKAACLKTHTPYLRVLRENPLAQQSFTEVESTASAAEHLAKTRAIALLTTGGKELAAFTVVPEYNKRLFVRVLPDRVSLNHCLELGFSPKNIICMQGPFSTELNLAMLRQVGAACLVTKASGSAGGFLEKCEAARLAGAELIVIGRPPEESGIYFNELHKALYERWGFTKPDINHREEPLGGGYFPLFVPLAGKPVVVLGAGAVAARRISVLLRFGACVSVISPKVCAEVQALAQAGRLQLNKRCYERGDCSAAALAVAATSSRTVNHSIYEECKTQNCPVSVADCKTECSFYFPGIASGGGVVAGITAGGQNHGLAARLTSRIDALLKEQGGETL